MNQNWAEKMASGFVTAEKLAPPEADTSGVALQNAPAVVRAAERWDEYDLLSRPAAQVALLRRNREGITGASQMWLEIAVFTDWSTARRVMELLQADHLVEETPTG